jgi:hypothetical protein
MWRATFLVVTHRFFGCGRDIVCLDRNAECKPTAIKYIHADAVCRYAALARRTGCSVVPFEKHRETSLWDAKCPDK